MRGRAVRGVRGPRNKRPVLAWPAPNAWAGTAAEIDECSAASVRVLFQEESAQCTAASTRKAPRAFAEKDASRRGLVVRAFFPRPKGARINKRRRQRERQPEEGESLIPPQEPFVTDPFSRRR